MKLVLLSDTHALHWDVEVPPADVLILAGDLTRRGDLADVESVDDWLATLPHRHKIVIAGNHDFCFERNPEAAQARLKHAVYLEDAEHVVEGLRIWGSPWQPWYHDWAFNLPRGLPLREKWDLIPAGVDVLVTHGPPYGLGDLCHDGRRVGCEELLARVRELRPRVHCFGHIHEGYGVYTEGETTCVNASTCDLRYRPVNPPVVLEI